MAWCVGSVFPTPQLLTGSALPPIGSLLLGPPRYLLNTGCELRYGADQDSNSRQQAASFLHEYKEAFVPQELLIDNLQEDASSQPAISRSFHAVGNRLEGVKNRDGSLQVFFPVGDNTDRIGSCSVPLDWNATSCRKYLHHDSCHNVLYSSSSSLLQPILQIVADKIRLSWGSSELANVPLAARTLYQVHLLTSRSKNDKILLDWRGVENFNYGTSHVVWNPHFPEEAAVLLENGDVIILDLNSPGSHVVSSAFSVDKRTSNKTFGLSNLEPRLKEKLRKKSVLDTPVTQNWWACEYAWHPKNLIVGERKEVYLIDVREKGGSKQFQHSLARVHCSSKLFSHCNQIYKTGHFTALTRADHDIFQFATASTNHVTVYDVRRANSPLLLWEHKMQREPPRLLQMFCLADVCPRFNNSLVMNATEGRVILACAYKSGETEAFLYGPKPRTCPLYSGSIKIEQAVDTFEELHAWEFPKKLKNWNAYRFKDLEHAFEAHENNLQTIIPKDCEIEELSGLCTSFPPSDSSDFAVLQLTGSGSIICQSLKLSEEVQSRHYELSGAVFKKRHMVRRNTGKCRTKHYRLEYLPAFMKYLQHGSILPNVKQNDCSATGEESPMDKVEEEQGEELGKSSSTHERIVSGEQEQPSMRRLDRQESNGKKDCQESLFEGKNSGSHGDESPEYFFHKMDAQLSLVNLSFTCKGHGMSLPAEELALLGGLKDQFHQWQQTFQPYLDLAPS